MQLLLALLALPVASFASSSGWSVLPKGFKPCCADGKIVSPGGGCADGSMSEGVDVDAAALPGHASCPAPIAPSCASGAEAEGGLTLEQCEAVCRKTPSCDSVSFNEDVGCFLKSNAAACARLKAKSVCEWNSDVNEIHKWSSHSYCSCDTPDVECTVDWGWPLIGVALLAPAVGVLLHSGDKLVRGGQPLLVNGALNGELLPLRLQLSQLMDLVSDGVQLSMRSFGSVKRRKYEQVVKGADVMSESEAAQRALARGVTPGGFDEEAKRAASEVEAAAEAEAKEEFKPLW